MVARMDEDRNTWLRIIQGLIEELKRLGYSEEEARRIVKFFARGVAPAEVGRQLFEAPRLEVTNPRTGARGPFQILPEHFHRTQTDPKNPYEYGQLAAKLFHNIAERNPSLKEAISSGKMSPQALDAFLRGWWGPAYKRQPNASTYVSRIKEGARRAGWVEPGAELEIPLERPQERPPDEPKQILPWEQWGVAAEPVVKVEKAEEITEVPTFEVKPTPEVKPEPVWPLAEEDVVARTIRRIVSGFRSFPTGDEPKDEGFVKRAQEFLRNQVQLALSPEQGERGILQIYGGNIRALPKVTVSRSRDGNEFIVKVGNTRVSVPVQQVVATYHRLLKENVDPNRVRDAILQSLTSPEEDFTGQFRATSWDIETAQRVIHSFFKEFGVDPYLTFRVTQEGDRIRVTIAPRTEGRAEGQRGREVSFTIPTGALMKWRIANTFPYLPLVTLSRDSATAVDPESGASVRLGPDQLNIIATEYNPTDANYFRKLSPAGVGGIFKKQSPHVFFARVSLPVQLKSETKKISFPLQVIIPPGGPRDDQAQLYMPFAASRVYEEALKLGLKDDEARQFTSRVMAKLQDLPRRIWQDLTGKGTVHRVVNEFFGDLMGFIHMLNSLEGEGGVIEEAFQKLWIPVPDTRGYTARYIYVGPEDILSKENAGYIARQFLNPLNIAVGRVVNLGIRTGRQTVQKLAEPAVSWLARTLGRPDRTSRLLTLLSEKSIPHASRLLSHDALKRIEQFTKALDKKLAQQFNREIQERFIPRPIKKIELAPTKTVDLDAPARNYITDLVEDALERSVPGVPEGTRKTITDTVVRALDEELRKMGAPGIDEQLERVARRARILKEDELNAFFQNVAQRIQGELGDRVDDLARQFSQAANIPFDEARDVLRRTAGAVSELPRVLGLTLMPEELAARAPRLAVEDLRRHIQNIVELKSGKVTRDVVERAQSSLDALRNIAQVSTNPELRRLSDVLGEAADDLKYILDLAPDVPEAREQYFNMVFGKARPSSMWAQIGQRLMPIFKESGEHLRIFNMRKDIASALGKDIASATDDELKRELAKRGVRDLDRAVRIIKSEQPPPINPNVERFVDHIVRASGMDRLMPTEEAKRAVTLMFSNVAEVIERASERGILSPERFGQVLDQVLEVGFWVLPPTYLAIRGMATADPEDIWELVPSLAAAIALPVALPYTIYGAGKYLRRMYAQNELNRNIIRDFIPSAFRAQYEKSISEFLSTVDKGVGDAVREFLQLQIPKKRRPTPPPPTEVTTPEPSPPTEVTTPEPPSPPTPTKPFVFTLVDLFGLNKSQIEDVRKAVSDLMNPDVPIRDALEQSKNGVSIKKAVFSGLLTIPHSEFEKAFGYATTIPINRILGDIRFTVDDKGNVTIMGMIPGQKPEVIGTIGGKDFLRVTTKASMLADINDFISKFRLGHPISRQSDIKDIVDTLNNIFRVTGVIAASIGGKAAERQALLNHQEFTDILKIAFPKRIAELQVSQGLRWFHEISPGASIEKSIDLGRWSEASQADPTNFSDFMKTIAGAEKKHNVGVAFSILSELSSKMADFPRKIKDFVSRLPLDDINEAHRDIVTHYRTSTGFGQKALPWGRDVQTTNEKVAAIERILWLGRAQEQLRESIQNVLKRHFPNDDVKVNELTDRLSWIVSPRVTEEGNVAIGIRPPRGIDVFDVLFDVYSQNSQAAREVAEEYRRFFEAIFPQGVDFKKDAWIDAIKSYAPPASPEGERSVLAKFIANTIDEGVAAYNTPSLRSHNSAILPFSADIARAVREALLKGDSKSLRQFANNSADLIELAQFLREVHEAVQKKNVELLDSKVIDVITEPIYVDALAGYATLRGIGVSRAEATKAVIDAIGNLANGSEQEKFIERLAAGRPDEQHFQKFVKWMSERMRSASGALPENERNRILSVFQALNDLDMKDKLPDEYQMALSFFSGGSPETIIPTLLYGSSGLSHATASMLDKLGFPIEGSPFVGDKLIQLSPFIQSPPPDMADAINWFAQARKQASQMPHIRERVTPEQDISSRIAPFLLSSVPPIYLSTDEDSEDDRITNAYITLLFGGAFAGTMLRRHVLSDITSPVRTAAVPTHPPITPKPVSELPRVEPPRETVFRIFGTTPPPYKGVTDIVASSLNFLKDIPLKGWEKFAYYMGQLTNVFAQAPYLRRWVSLDIKRRRIQERQRPTTRRPTKPIEEEVEGGEVIDIDRLLREYPEEERRILMWEVPEEKPVETLREYPEEELKKPVKIEWTTEEEIVWVSHVERVFRELSAGTQSDPRKERRRWQRIFHDIREYFSPKKVPKRTPDGGTEFKEVPPPTPPKDVDLTFIESVAQDPTLLQDADTAQKAYNTVRSVLNFWTEVEHDIPLPSYPRSAFLDALTHTIQGMSPSGLEQLARFVAGEEGAQLPAALQFLAPYRDQLVRLIGQDYARTFVSAKKLTVDDIIRQKREALRKLGFTDDQIRQAAIKLYNEQSAGGVSIEDFRNHILSRLREGGDPAAFVDSIASSVSLKPFLDVLAKGQHNLTEPEGRAAFLEDVFGIVNEQFPLGALMDDPEGSNIFYRFMKLGMEEGGLDRIIESGTPEIGTYFAGDIMLPVIDPKVEERPIRAYPPGLLKSLYEMGIAPLVGLVSVEKNKVIPILPVPMLDELGFPPRYAAIALATVGRDTTRAFAEALGRALTASSQDDFVKSLATVHALLGGGRAVWDHKSNSFFLSYKVKDSVGGIFDKISPFLHDDVIEALRKRGQELGIEEGKMLNLFPHAQDVERINAILKRAVELKHAALDDITDPNVNQSVLRRQGYEIPLGAGAKTDEHGNIVETGPFILTRNIPELDVDNARIILEAMKQHTVPEKLNPEGVAQLSDFIATMPTVLASSLQNLLASWGPLRMPQRGSLMRPIFVQETPKHVAAQTILTSLFGTNAHNVVRFVDSWLFDKINPFARDYSGWPLDVSRRLFDIGEDTVQNIVKTFPGIGEDEARALLPPVVLLEKEKVPRLIVAYTPLEEIVHRILRRWENNMSKRQGIEVLDDKAVGLTAIPVEKEHGLFRPLGYYLGKITVALGHAHEAKGVLDQTLTDIEGIIARTYRDRREKLPATAEELDAFITAAKSSFRSGFEVGVNEAKKEYGEYLASTPVEFSLDIGRPMLAEWVKYSEIAPADYISDSLVKILRHPHVGPDDLQGAFARLADHMTPRARRELADVITKVWGDVERRLARPREGPIDRTPSLNAIISALTEGKKPERKGGLEDIVFSTIREDMVLRPDVEQVYKNSVIKAVSDVIQRLKEAGGIHETDAEFLTKAIEDGGGGIFLYLYTHPKAFDNAISSILSHADRWKAFMEKIYGVKEGAGPLRYFGPFDAAGIFGYDAARPFPVLRYWYFLESLADNVRRHIIHHAPRLLRELDFGDVRLDDITDRKQQMQLIAHGLVDYILNGGSDSTHYAMREAQPIVWWALYPVGKLPKHDPIHAELWSLGIPIGMLPVLEDEKDDDAKRRLGAFMVFAPLLGLSAPKVFQYAARRIKNGDFHVNSPAFFQSLYSPHIGMAQIAPFLNAQFYPLHRILVGTGPALAKLRSGLKILTGRMKDIHEQVANTLSSIWAAMQTGADILTKQDLAEFFDPIAQYLKLDNGKQLLAALNSIVKELADGTYVPRGDVPKAVEVLAVAELQEGGWVASRILWSVNKFLAGLKREGEIGPELNTIMADIGRLSLQPVSAVSSDLTRIIDTAAKRTFGTLGTLFVGNPALVEKEWRRILKDYGFAASLIGDLIRTGAIPVDANSPSASVGFAHTVLRQAHDLVSMLMELRLKWGEYKGPAVNVNEYDVALGRVINSGIRGESYHGAISRWIMDTIKALADVTLQSPIFDGSPLYGVGLHPRIRLSGERVYFGVGKNGIIVPLSVSYHDATPRLAFEKAVRAAHMLARSSATPELFEPILHDPQSRIFSIERTRGQRIPSFTISTPDEMASLTVSIVKDPPDLTVRVSLSAEEPTHASVTISSGSTSVVLNENTPSAEIPVGDNLTARMGNRPVFSIPRDVLESMSEHSSAEDWRGFLGIAHNNDPALLPVSASQLSSSASRAAADILYNLIGRLDPRPAARKIWEGFNAVANAPAWIPEAAGPLSMGEVGFGGGRLADAAYRTFSIFRNALVGSAMSLYASTIGNSVQALHSMAFLSRELLSRYASLLKKQNKEPEKEAVRAQARFLMGMIPTWAAILESEVGDAIRQEIGKIGRAAWNTHPLSMMTQLARRTLRSMMRNKSEMEIPGTGGTLTVHRQPDGRLQLFVTVDRPDQTGHMVATQVPLSEFLDSIVPGWKAEAIGIMRTLIHGPQTTLGKESTFLSQVRAATDILLNAWTLSAFKMQELLNRAIVPTLTYAVGRASGLDGQNALTLAARSQAAVNTHSSPYTRPYIVTGVGISQGSRLLPTLLSSAWTLTGTAYSLATEGLRSSLVNIGETARRFSKGELREGGWALASVLLNSAIMLGLLGLGGMSVMPVLEIAWTTYRAAKGGRDEHGDELPQSFAEAMLRRKDDPVVRFLSRGIVGSLYSLIFSPLDLDVDVTARLGFVDNLIARIRQILQPPSGSSTEVLKGIIPPLSPILSVANLATVLLEDSPQRQDVLRALQAIAPPNFRYKLMEEFLNEIEAAASRGGESLWSYFTTMISELARGNPRVWRTIMTVLTGIGSMDARYSSEAIRYLRKQKELDPKVLARAQTYLLLFDSPDTAETGREEDMENTAIADRLGRVLLYYGINLDTQGAGASAREFMYTISPMTAKNILAYGLGYDLRDFPDVRAIIEILSRMPERERVVTALKDIATIPEGERLGYVASKLVDIADRLSPDQIRRLFHEGPESQRVARLLEALGRARSLIHSYLLRSHAANTIRETFDRVVNAPTKLPYGDSTVTVHIRLGQNGDLSGLNAMNAALLKATALAKNVFAVEDVESENIFFPDIVRFSLDDLTRALRRMTTSKSIAGRSSSLVFIENLDEARIVSDIISRFLNAYEDVADEIGQRAVAAIGVGIEAARRNRNEFELFLQPTDEHGNPKRLTEIDAAWDAQRAQIAERILHKSGWNELPSEHRRLFIRVIRAVRTRGGTDIEALPITVEEETPREPVGAVSWFDWR